MRVKLQSGTKTAPRNGRYTSIQPDQICLNLTYLWVILLKFGLYLTEDSIVMKLIATALALMFLVPAVSFSQTSDVVVPGPYLIHPGDKIEGKVLGESDFDFKVEVDDTGKFRLPYVNDAEISALCRSEREVNDQVTKLYSRYLRDPMVSVRVTERRQPTPVTVSGEVRSPQRVEMRRQARLLELISFSGGFTEDAGGTVQVFRTQVPLCASADIKKEWMAESSNGSEVPSRMYSRSSITQGTKESNPIIYPGDIIIVDKAAPVYLTGEVVQATGVYIKEGGLSLTQALAMVGGVREKAKKKDIKIYRLKGPNPRDRQTITVNLERIQAGTQDDIMLEPYDIIEVDRAKDSIAQTILKIVAGAGRTAASSFATGGARILY